MTHYGLLSRLQKAKHGLTFFCLRKEQRTEYTKTGSTLSSKQGLYTKAFSNYLSVGSRDKVTRFLKCLENNGMVKTTSNTTDGTTVTIENWYFYQSKQQQSSQRLNEKRDSKPTTGRHNKEGIKKIRRKEEYSAHTASPKKGEPSRRVPDAFKERFGDDYEAYEEWANQ